MSLIITPPLQHFHDSDNNHKTKPKKIPFCCFPTVQPPTHHPPTLPDPGIEEKIMMMMIIIMVMVVMMTMMTMMMV